MYNKSPMLPISLQRKCARRVLVRVIPCILLLFSFAYVLIYWGDSIFPLDKRYDGSTLDGVKIMLCIFVMVLPFVICGVPFKLIDSSWSGTVIQTDIVSGIGVADRGGERPMPYHKNDLVLTVKKDNGKIIKYTVLSLDARRSQSANENIDNGKMEQQEAKFRVGDRVHKYYGFKNLYSLHADERSCKYCVDCGTANKLYRKACWYCGSDLIQTPSLSNTFIKEAHR